MAKTLQFRRDTTSNLSSITAAVGELFVDTTKKTVVVGDGSTAGGFPLQRELVSNTNIKTVNGNSLLGSGDLTISGGGGSFPTVVNNRVSLSTQTLDFTYTATALTLSVTPSSTSAPVFVSFNFQVEAVDNEYDGGILLQLYKDGSAVSNSELSCFLMDNGVAAYAGYPMTYTFAFIPGTSSSTTLTLYARKTGGNTTKIGSDIAPYGQCNAIVW